MRCASSSPPAEAIFLDAKFEAELIELDDDEAKEMLESTGQEESGLDQLARVGFDTLGLQTYLTAGPKESRAWTIPPKGATAPTGRRCHPHRLRARLHQGGDRLLRPPHRGRLHERGQGPWLGPHGGQGLRHARRGMLLSFGLTSSVIDAGRCILVS